MLLPGVQHCVQIFLSSSLHYPTKYSIFYKVTSVSFSFPVPFSVLVSSFVIQLGSSVIVCIPFFFIPPISYYCFCFNVHSAMDGSMNSNK